MQLSEQQISHCDVWNTRLDWVKAVILEVWYQHSKQLISEFEGLKRLARSQQDHQDKLFRLSNKLLLSSSENKLNFWEKTVEWIWKNRYNNLQHNLQRRSPRSQLTMNVKFSQNYNKNCWNKQEACHLIHFPAKPHSITASKRKFHNSKIPQIHNKKFW